MKKSRVHNAIKSHKSFFFIFILFFIAMIIVGGGIVFAEGSDKQPQEVIVYYDHGDKNNYYHPSVQFGDEKDLNINDRSTFNPQSGMTCIKVIYTPKGDFGWAGLYWLNPADNWGVIDDGIDLSFAKKLTFWAKGENGGEKVAVFKYGGIKNIYNDSDNHGIGPVELTDKWQQYTIDLSKRNLKYIIGGFCFQISKLHNLRGATFYIDNIRYENGGGDN
ncbi:MAG: hypothetical protein ABH952_00650 [Candidatus Omnitrophota bacterium]